MAIATNDREGWTAWSSVVRLPEFPVDPRNTALIVIDMTYQQASRHHGLCKRILDSGHGDDLEYYMSRIENTVVPNLAELIEGFRAQNAAVVFTRCASLRGDGSDQTWRHRSFGLICGVDSKDAQILDEIAPKDGDTLLTKTGSNVFTSTNCEHLLHLMGVTTIVVTGIFTNSCVEGTIRVAGDLDFRCLMAEDACAAMSRSGHANAIEYLDGNFCHVKSSVEILQLISEHAPARNSAA